MQQPIHRSQRLAALWHGFDSDNGRSCISSMEPVRLVTRPPSGRASPTKLRTDRAWNDYVVDSVSNMLSILKPGALPHWKNPFEVYLDGVIEFIPRSPPPSSSPPTRSTTPGDGRTPHSTESHPGTASTPWSSTTSCKRPRENDEDEDAQLLDSRTKRNSSRKFVRLSPTSKIHANEDARQSKAAEEVSGNDQVHKPHSMVPRLKARSRSGS